MKDKKILLILFLVPFFLFMASADKERSSAALEFFGKSINFIILFGGLAYLLSKPIRNFLEKRSQDIERSIKEAGASRLEAEMRFQETESRLTGLGEEIARLKDDAELEGRRIEARIAQLAEQEGERIRYFAQQEIEMLFKAELRELRAYAAELAIKMAEERIRKKMTPRSQSFLINESIERLEKLHEKSGPDQKVHPRLN